MLGGGGDVLGGGGDEMAGGGVEVVGGGDEVAGGGDEVAGGGNEVAGGGDEVACGGDEVAGGGDDPGGGEDGAQHPQWFLRLCFSILTLTHSLLAGFPWEWVSHVLAPLESQSRTKAPYSLRHLAIDFALATHFP